MNHIVSIVACDTYGELHMGVRWETLRERDNLENFGADGSVILKCILRKYFDRRWPGLIWLTRTSSMLLCTRQ